MRIDVQFTSAGISDRAVQFTDQPEALLVEDVEETLQNLEVEGRRQLAAPVLPPGTCLSMQMSGIFKVNEIRISDLPVVRNMQLPSQGLKYEYSTLLVIIFELDRIGLSMNIQSAARNAPQFYYYVNLFYTIR